MTKASNNEFPSVLFDEQASDVATPATGFWRAYFKSDGIHVIDDAGAVTGPLTAGTSLDAAFSGQVGDWRQTASSVNSTLAMTTNREYAVPLYVPDGRTLDRVAIEVTSAAAGSVIRMGVREDDDGYPGDLVAEAAATADSTTTGEKQLTIVANPGAGWCFIVAKAEGGSPSVLRAQGPVGRPIALNGPRLGVFPFPYVDTTAGAFPTAHPGTRGQVASEAPFMAARLA